MNSIDIKKSIHNLRISSLEFWGTLALLSTDDIEDKINFCFRLMVANEDFSVLDDDPYLGYNDLVVLLICLTRGVTKVKNMVNIPSEVSMFT